MPPDARRSTTPNARRVDPVLIVIVSVGATMLALLLFTTLARPITAGPPGPEWITFGSAPLAGSGDDEWDVWIAPVDGSTPARNLTHRVGFDSAEGWSADGRILYRRGDGGTVELWSMNFDGSSPERLVAGNWIVQGAWSPQDRFGDTLAYIEGGPTDPGLYTWNGQSDRLLVPGSVAAFDWSPSGRELAVLLGDGRVVRVAAGTGELADIGRGMPTYFPQIAWSSDGSHIAYTSGLSDSVELRVIATDGGQPATVTQSLTAFHWTLDGEALVYVDGGTRGPLKQWQLESAATKTIYPLPVGFSLITPDEVGVFEVESCEGCAEGFLLSSALDKPVTVPVTETPAIFGRLFVWPAT